LRKERECIQQRDDAEVRSQLALLGGAQLAQLAATGMDELGASA
jgi:hypothetical protein